jgi:adenylate cyclase
VQLASGWERTAEGVTVAIEIERKFLVKRDAWHADPRRGTAVRQGYLSDDPARAVRVRIAGDRGSLTVKGLTVGIERHEFEYEIPIRDAGILLDTMCVRPLVEKTRYRVEHAGRVWEVDEFGGENAGLVIAEVELPAADAPLSLPDWVGAEVSHDPRYFNVNLARHPFREWGGAHGGD